jgi:tRNA pseudouridine55 synthase
MAAVILPGTGRGTMRSMVEGAFHRRSPLWRPPSTIGCADGPPPRAGEER